MPIEAAPEPAQNQMRVLVLPPTRADANAMVKLLGATPIAFQIFPDMAELCAALPMGAGAVLISEEALIAEIDRLESFIGAQPVWSDVPIIVLSRSGAESSQLSEAVRRIGNASVVERPVRVTTLISLIRTALRARDRQYQVRDRLIEREQLLESERQARAEAERAGRMKDEFLATLSHELRTPLNAMLGWSQLLRNTSDLPGDVEEGLTIIERNARSQTQIIEDLLDMSRIISGKVRLDVQRVELTAIVNSAIETVRPAAQARGVRLQFVADGAPPIVRADANRLQQIFWNLLANAVKFTPSEGRVTAAVETIGACVRVTVTDTGDGIDPAFLPHVFDRFRQADASSTRKHGGLGLGLSIVKQLVELHGGTITAASDGANRGAAFEVLLPLAGAGAIAEQADAPCDEAQPVVTALAGVSRIRGELQAVNVLVVDDEPDARTLLRRLLEDAHATVHTASSASEAIDMLMREQPDVLVSDIGMPEEDGYALIRRVRSLRAERGGLTPAIALTAYARAEDRAKAINSGFQQHMAKPVEPSELVAAIARLVGHLSISE